MCLVTERQVPLPTAVAATAAVPKQSSQPDKPAAKSADENNQTAKKAKKGIFKMLPLLITIDFFNHIY